MFAPQNATNAWAVHAASLQHVEGRAGEAEASYLLLERPARHAAAACRGTMSGGANDWFAGKDDHTARLRARRICFTCPVQVECGQHAETWPERWGVWGGASTRERSRTRGTRLT